MVFRLLSILFFAAASGLFQNRYRSRAYSITLSRGIRIWAGTRSSLGMSLVSYSPPATDARKSWTNTSEACSLRWNPFQRCWKSIRNLEAVHWIAFGAPSFMSSISSSVSGIHLTISVKPVIPKRYFRWLRTWYYYRQISEPS